jgi:deazaflavin-dependent oxidoreductase (nitroreductase family)
MPASGSLADILEGQSRARRLGNAIGALVDVPVLGRVVARLMRLPTLMRPATIRVTRLHAWLLRLTGGRMRRSWLFAAGQPVLSLTTTGRRSGQPRSTTVACFRYGDTLALAAMALGSSRDPAWALNLEANPDARIDLAGQCISVTARRAVGDEADLLWQQWLQVQPSAKAFRELAGRDIPLFVLSRRSD